MHIILMNTTNEKVNVYREKIGGSFSINGRNFSFHLINFRPWNDFGAVNTTRRVCMHSNAHGLSLVQSRLVELE